MSQKTASATNEEENTDESSDSSISTTGWTTSEDDDDEEQGDEDREDTVADQQQRAAERLRVLEAAGILVLGGEKMEDSKNEDVVKSPKGAEEVFLHRRKSTIKKGKQEHPPGALKKKSSRQFHEKPKRPSRPPPIPPKEQKPEERMEDAYDRYVKLTQQMQQAHQSEKVGASSASSPPVQASNQKPSSPSPSSPHPIVGGSVIAAGTGLLSSIRSRIAAGGSTSPGERRVTPTISGPIATQSLQGESSTEEASVPSGDKSQDQHPAGVRGSTNTSWTSLMGADTVRDLPDSERKRQEAIFEFITTESTHVRDLQIIVEVFFNAMQPILDAKAATVIFANVEEILLAAVSLLSDLEGRQRTSRLFITQIGDVLQTHMANMSVYIPYCVNQETATSILASERTRNIQLESLLAKLRNEHPSARGLDLSHFLLIPSKYIYHTCLYFSRFSQSATSDPISIINFSNSPLYQRAHRSQRNPSSPRCYEHSSKIFGHNKRIYSPTSIRRAPSSTVRKIECRVLRNSN